MAQHADLHDELIAVVAALRPGEVVSYGDIADDAGFPGRARAVGRALATTTREVPWWRVVRSDGRVVTGRDGDQAGRLRAEGVTVTDGRVVRSQYGRFARPERDGTAQAGSAATG